MEKGIVKWFNETKGFGFIQRLNGQDVYVHANAIVSKDYKHNLTSGDNVVFEVEKRMKGLSAYRVAKVSFQ